MADLQRQIDLLEQGNEKDAGPGELQTRPPRELPLEIFVNIGQYLAPGSRTLFCLAATCKILHALLLPRLLEKLDSNVISDPKFTYFRRKCLDERSKYIKELDLFPVNLPMDDKTTPALVNATRDLFRRCSRNLRSLTVKMDDIPLFDGFSSFKFFKLETLVLKEAPDYLPDWFAEKISHVRTLQIEQRCYNELSFELEFWSILGKFGNLRELDLVRLAPHHEALASLPNLVSKIRVYGVTCFYSLRKLLTVPEFRPKTLIFDWIGWPYDVSEAREFWGKLVKMERLEHFEALSFDFKLVREFGLPPNVEMFKITHMDCYDVLRPNNGGLFKVVKGRMPRSLPTLWIDFNVYDYPVKGSKAYQKLFDRLCLWDSLNAEGRRMSLHSDGDQKLEELEELVWQRKMAARQGSAGVSRLV